MFVIKNQTFWYMTFAFILIYIICIVLCMFIFELDIKIGNIRHIFDFFFLHRTVYIHDTKIRLNSLYTAPENAMQTTLCIV